MSEPERKHPSHKTRFSDSSFYDEVCEVCGATDQVPGGWGELGKPCPATPSPPQDPRDEALRVARHFLKVHHWNDNAPGRGCWDLDAAKEAYESIDAVLSNERKPSMGEK